MVSASGEEATKLGEEISMPVGYQGRQIQLTGWFEKPAAAGRSRPSSSHTAIRAITLI
jgi:hypothetical protein